MEEAIPKKRRRIRERVYRRFSLKKRLIVGKALINNREGF